MIRVLPANIANMIAAGEVVQRPASVVKELMENAVDAGATSITVVISDSGRTLIQVIDNGCGMSAQEANLCFERHATSKIESAEDLGHILTFGFRGEALASIAAVADVTIKTRREQDETAVQVRVSGGSAPESSEISAPVGSNFAVRNLFYNIPARRKFLKSDTVEFKHIMEEFTRVALTRSDIEFRLVNDGRDVYVLKPAKSLKFRVTDVLGGSVVSSVVDVEAHTSVVDVTGFVGRPDVARKTTGSQFFFVNGRFFRSPYFHKAVMKAYEGFIPEGLTPPYIIFLEADPSTMDINIHPTKTEIKFEEEAVLFQILYACIKETLGKNSFGASIDFDVAGAVDIPVFGNNFDEYRPMTPPAADFDGSYDPFNDAPSDKFDFGGSGYVTKSDNYGALFEEKALPPAEVLFQGKYIFAPSRTGIMIVDVKRARERILYERFLSAMSRGGHVVQKALFPVQVNVGKIQRLIFDENAEILSSLGFDISTVGDDTVEVNGVPEGYSCEPGKVQEMVQNLLFLLSEETNDLPEMMAASMARKLSLLGAFGAAPVGSAFEAKHLLEELLSCDNSEFTTEGHRIISILKTEDIEKNFD